MVIARGERVRFGVPEFQSSRATAFLSSRAPEFQSSRVPEFLKHRPEDDNPLPKLSSRLKNTHRDACPPFAATTPTLQSVCKPCPRAPWGMNDAPTLDYGLLLSPAGSSLLPGGGGVFGPAAASSRRHRRGRRRRHRRRRRQRIGGISSGGPPLALGVADAEQSTALAFVGLSCSPHLPAGPVLPDPPATPTSRMPSSSWTDHKEGLERGQFDYALV
ncbi:LOW QUALITY PROTEIN: hypothetical protein CRUP_031392 [Coryphaenoides rupestris]|nr:LOW QUALITY PROTEIN: hypothetical protein CRUP_031392 [Coryphaenoides rupestris]